MDIVTDAIRDRRKERQNESRFKSLIATPQNIKVSTTLTMPANARLAIDSTVDSALNNIQITAGTRTIKPVMGPNIIRSLGWFERGKKLTFAIVAPGTYRVYLVRSNGKRSIIGTGTYP